MKTTITAPKEIELTTIRIQVDVRYEEEDIPNDFPMRRGDLWDATVEIDTGKIQDWPQGKSGYLYMKVSDCGQYNLYDSNGTMVAEISGYVPHGIVPGEYGDYIDLKIDDAGVITNWPSTPDVSEFFNLED